MLKPLRYMVNIIEFITSNSVKWLASENMYIHMYVCMCLCVCARLWCVKRMQARRAAMARKNTYIDA